ncbi:unnamed protein product [Mucor circinelloides]
MSSSSLEKFNIDFSHLSFDLPNPVLDLKSDRQQISQQAPQASKRPGMTPRSTSRNKQCMPSDDEDDEEEEEEEEQDSDNEINKVPRGVQKLAISTPSITKPIRKSRPLPSDDEDSEDEEDADEQQGEGEKQRTTSVAGGNRLHPNGNHAYQDYASYMQYQNYQQEDNDDDDDRALVTNPNAGPVLTLVEGTHLQQLHQKQQQHQAQLAQFQYQQQQQQLQQQYYHQNHQHYQQQQQQHKSRGNVSMSGMDLLKQLEQEKADSKRIKPKLDTSKVKIEGLLGKLPEPGSHNISFQQIQQQQQHHHRKKNQYLDPFTLEKSRSPSPSRNSQRISHISKQ